MDTEKSFSDQNQTLVSNRKNWKKLKRFLWIAYAILKILKLLKELFRTWA
jgi:hypothetical protein